jgi:hypothetical protein
MYLDRRAVKSVSVPVCGDPMTAENYDKAVRPIYFDFANPTSGEYDFIIAIVRSHPWSQRPETPL